MNNFLKAPFPYWGGKARAAPLVWKYFGEVDVYIEPFYGTGAVHLNCPYGARPKEVVNDLDGLLTNFWRCIKYAPAETAEWADYPTSHLDLTARKDYLAHKREDLVERLIADPEFYDAQVGGWWVWVASNSIGLARDIQCTCGGGGKVGKRPHIMPYQDTGRGVSAQRKTIVGERPQMNHSPGGNGVQTQRKVIGKRPLIDKSGNGIGVQMQRKGVGELPNIMPDLNTGKGVSAQRKSVGEITHIGSGQGVQPQHKGTGKRPYIASADKGVGVAAQRKDMGVMGSRPFIDHKPSGQGIQLHRTDIPTATPLTGDRLFAWFDMLSRRLERTYITCKDWATLCSPSVLSQTPTSPANTIAGIFLDPPYATEGRATLYNHDSTSIAHDVQQWAIKMGDNPRIRICVAGYIDDYEPWPDGWETATWGTDGLRMGGEKAGYDRTEVLWFSPHCVPQPKQERLL